MPPWISDIVDNLRKIIINPQLSTCLYTSILSREECLKIFDSFIEEIQKKEKIFMSVFKKKCNPIEKFFNKPKEIKYPKALFCPVSTNEYRFLEKKKQQILKTHSCLFLYLLTEWITFLQQVFRRIKCKKEEIFHQKKYLVEAIYTTIWFYLQFIEQILGQPVTSGSLSETPSGLDFYFAPLQFYTNPYSMSFRIPLIAIPSLLRSKIEENLWKGLGIEIPSLERRKIKISDLIDLYERLIANGLINRKNNLETLKWILDIFNCMIHATKPLYPWLIFPLNIDLNEYVKFYFPSPSDETEYQKKQLTNIIETWAKEKKISKVMIKDNIIKITDKR